MNASVPEARSEPFNSLGGQAIAWLDENGTVVVDNRLLQCDYPSDFEAAERATQCVKWIFHIHEHQTANDRIYSRFDLDFTKIPGNEPYVGQVIGLSPLLGECHLGPITVCTNYAASWPDKSSGQECDITGSRADIQDAHARGDAGLFE